MTVPDLDKIDEGELLQNQLSIITEQCSGLENDVIDQEDSIMEIEQN